jgi:hypothetical protein
MKKLLLLAALFGVAVVAPACKKKEKTTKVVKAKKADAAETKQYHVARGDK